MNEYEDLSVHGGRRERQREHISILKTRINAEKCDTEIGRYRVNAGSRELSLEVDMAISKRKGKGREENSRGGRGGVVVVLVAVAVVVVVVIGGGKVKFDVIQQDIFVHSFYL